MTLTERKNARETEKERARSSLADVRSGAALTTCTRVHADKRSTRRTRDRLASLMDETRDGGDATARWSLRVPRDRAASRSSRSTRCTAGDDAAPTCLVACSVVRLGFIRDIVYWDAIDLMGYGMRFARRDQTKRDETKRDDTKRDEGSDNEQERILG